MELIHHRRNSIQDLMATEKKYGVEVDIRTKGSDLIIHHDPFFSGLLFSDWLRSYDHGTLILNVKEEGLEQRLLDILIEKKVEKFFFLDQSFPFLLKTASAGERRCAVRVSEYESVDTALSMVGKVDWVWLDCFTKFPISASEYKALRDGGFKLCLVSPELQGRDSASEIEEMSRLLKEGAMIMDAVCTKRIDLWEGFDW